MKYQSDLDHNSSRYINKLFVLPTASRVKAEEHPRPAASDAPARMLGLARDAARWWRKNKQHEPRNTWQTLRQTVGSVPRQPGVTQTQTRTQMMLPPLVGHEENGGTRARGVAIIFVTPVNRMTLDEWRNPMQKTRWRRTPSPALEFTRILLRRRPAS